MHKHSTALFVALLFSGSLTGCATDVPGEITGSPEVVEEELEPLLSLCPTSLLMPVAEVTKTPVLGSTSEAILLHHPASGTSYTADIRFPSGAWGYRPLVAISHGTDAPGDCAAKSMKIDVWAKSASNGCWAYVGSSSVGGVLGATCSLGESSSRGPEIHLPSHTSVVKVKLTSKQGDTWMPADLSTSWYLP